jgi:Family of unknown function (DUF6636)
VFPESTDQMPISGRSSSPPAGHQFGTAVASVGGSAGEPSVRWSLKWYIRLSVSGTGAWDRMATRPYRVHRGKLPALIIWSTAVDRPVPFIGCGIKSGLKPAPPRRPCSEGGYAGDRVIMTATGRVTVPACAGDPGALVGAPTARLLGYGKTRSRDGISCRSTFAGLTCRNGSGHGFFLSRARYRTF